MGTKKNWFSSVKKAFSPESKKSKKSKKGKSAVPDPSPSETVTVSHLLPPSEEEKLPEAEHEQTKHAYHSEVAETVATDSASTAVQSTAEVVPVPAVTQFNGGKLKEEVAAIKIQVAFRGYLARRALRALRGLVRLKSLVQGTPVKRQTANALRCMQTLARVQCQLQSRRIRMLEENQALQRQLLQKHAKELASLQIGQEWDDSLQSKEQIEASLLSKYEAAMRRERARAYSFTHQQTWKKATRSAALMFMDLNNPHWGWSWLERWTAASCPWETHSMTNKDTNSENSSVKSASLGQAGGLITKSYARHQLNSDKPSPTSNQKPSPHPSIYQSSSTPSPKAASSAVPQKFKPATSRGSLVSPDDDANSSFSMLSERNRRHSIASSMIRDDESLASSPSFPSYMAPTRSAKAKLRMQSPLGLENGTPEKEAATGSAKKRLSFPPSPARPRRHSGPPKVDTSSITEHERNGEAS